MSPPAREFSAMSRHNESASATRREHHNGCTLSLPKSDLIGGKPLFENYTYMYTCSGKARLHEASLATPMTLKCQKRRGVPSWSTSPVFSPAFVAKRLRWYCL